MVIKLPPNLPVGFRFHPTDAELVTPYLRPKILGEHYNVDAIAEVDFSGSDPWELPGKSKIQMNDRLWWFLCHQENKYPGSRRSNRTTKTGFWKITGQERMIRDENTKVCIGKKKTLVFYSGRTPGKRTNWVMQEIYLDPHTLPVPTQENLTESYVIRKLKKKADEKVDKVAPNSKNQADSETQMDIGCDLEPIENKFTDEEIRSMLSDESVEDFADKCIVDDSDYCDETIHVTDKNNMQTPLKRSKYSSAAHGATSQYSQTEETFNQHLESCVNSKKVRHMRMMQPPQTMELQASSKGLINAYFSVTGESHQRRINYHKTGLAKILRILSVVVTIVTMIINLVTKRNIGCRYYLPIARLITCFIFVIFVRMVVKTVSCAICFG